MQPFVENTGNNKDTTCNASRGKEMQKSFADRTNSFLSLILAMPMDEQTRSGNATQPAVEMIRPESLGSMVEKQFRYRCVSTFSSYHPYQGLRATLYSASDEDFRAHKAIVTLLVHARITIVLLILSHPTIGFQPAPFCIVRGVFRYRRFRSSEPEFQRLAEPPAREKQSPHHPREPSSRLLRAPLHPSLSITYQ